MIRSLKVFCFVLFLVGCGSANPPVPSQSQVSTSPTVAASVGQGQGRSAGESAIQASAAEEPVDRPLTLADARPDLMAVALGVFREMQGASEDSLVFFELPLLRDESISVEGFALVNVVLERDEQIGDDPLFRRAGGTLQLKDTLLRTMYWSFVAEYVIGDAGILVLSSAALPLYGFYDEVDFYVVESHKLAPLSYLKAMPYHEMLELVSAQALTPQELSQKQGGAAYKIFAFNKVLADSQHRMAIYTNDAYGGAQVEFAHTNISKGWQYAMLEGQFRLNQAPHFDLVAMREAPGQPAKPLGAFRSRFK